MLVDLLISPPTSIHAFWFSLSAYCCRSSCSATTRRRTLWHNPSSHHQLVIAVDAGADVVVSTRCWHRANLVVAVNVGNSGASSSTQSTEQSNEGAEEGASIGPRLFYASKNDICSLEMIQKITSRSLIKKLDIQRVHSLRKPQRTEW